MNLNLSEMVFVRRANDAFQRILPWRKAQIRREILSRMDTLIRERPTHLNLELNTACNAKCVFCAYPKVKRPFRNLPIDLYQKIIDDFAAIGGGCVGLSALISDPLLDPHLIERIRYLERYASLEAHVFTNGIKFTHFSDQDLIYILDKLKHIDISIGGMNRGDYQQMFGVDMFDRVWESLERLAKLREQSQANCRLILHVRTNKKRKVREDERLAYLRSLGYVVDDILDKFSDWGGIVKAEHLPEGASMAEVDNSKVSTPCLIPMTYLTVLPDGRVNVCACMDVTEDFIVGDLNDQSIVEIWQSPAYLEFRSSFRPGCVHRLCQHCSYYSRTPRHYRNRSMPTISPGRVSGRLEGTCD